MALTDQNAPLSLVDQDSGTDRMTLPSDGTTVCTLSPSGKLLAAMNQRHVELRRVPSRLVLLAQARLRGLFRR